MLDLKFILGFVLSFMTANALAKEGFTNLPGHGFVLLESSVHFDKETLFTSTNENGYLLLSSNLSPQWRKGVFFNPQNGRVTVPGVGAASLVKTTEGYTWSIQTQEPTFEKKGSMSLTRKKQGCELSWSFFVISRGQTLLNESGRLGYSCSTGSYSSTLVQK